MSDDDGRPGGKLPMPKSATGTVLGMAPAQRPETSEAAPARPVPQSADATVRDPDPPAFHGDAQAASPPQRKRIPSAEATVLGVGARPPEQGLEPQPELDDGPQPAAPPSKRKWLLDEDSEMERARAHKRSNRLWVWILGGTLVGVILMVSVLALGGILVGDAADDANVQTAHTQAMTISGATELYRVSGIGRCPTVSDLVAGGYLDPSASHADPWGGPFRIECSADSVRVTSSGPDGTAGTDDDITAP